MALIIIRSLKSSANKTTSIGNSQAFCKVIRFSYQSRADQVHAKLVKRWRFLAELLDLPNEESRRIVLKTKGVQNMSESHLKQMAVVFKEIQVVPENLSVYPEILSCFPVQIEQRHHCLKELGVQPVNIPEILRYSTLIKRNAYDLKLLHLMPADVDPLDHLLCQLPFLKLEFLAKHPNLRNMSLLYIRKVVLLECLSQKLKWQKNEVLQLIESYPVLSHRSICFHRATIELWVDTLGLSISKLKLSKYLLTIQPSNVEKVLSDIPYLGGQAIKSVIQQHPRLLLAPAEQILMTNEYLTQIGINDIQMANCWGIFLLNTATVQQLLNEIITTLPFVETKTHPRILSCIYHLHVAKQKLQSQGLTYTSSEALDIMNKDLRLKPCRKRSPDDSFNEQISYIAEQLSREVSSIRQQLVRHPRRHLYHMQNSRRILNYLIEEGFSKLQIENALHLVMYDVDTIKTNLEALPLHKDIEMFGDWKTHQYILQLMLYEIERNYSGAKKYDKYAQKVKSSAKEVPNIFQIADQSENYHILNYQTQLPDLKFNASSLDNPENECFEKHIFWE